jgi:hypothetical protein
MIENNRALSVVTGDLEVARLWREARLDLRSSRLGCGAFPTLAAETRALAIRPIHRNCGQLCGQLVLQRSKAAKLLGLAQFAQSLGMRKSFKIKGLYGNDGTVTGTSRREPRFRAVVEFSSLASIGLARD